jgi:predicted HTH domain antitoxin
MGCRAGAVAVRDAVANVQERKHHVSVSKTLAVAYPDALPDMLNMSRSEFEREAKLATSVKLFETGKLSSSQAAELAGMARVDFLFELKRFGVSPIQTTADELHEEIANAKKAAGRR